MNGPDTEFLGSQWGALKAGAPVGSPRSDPILAGDQPLAQLALVPYPVHLAPGIQANLS